MSISEFKTTLIPQTGGDNYNIKWPLHGVIMYRNRKKERRKIMESPILQLLF